jgi:putative photosynthetic complex assembly protein
MSHSHHNQSFPRSALLAAAALVAMALVSAAVTRSMGAYVMERPPSTVTASADLRFADRDDGAVTVSRVPEGSTIAVLDPGTNGFVRGVLRGLARERRFRGVGAEEPFRLTRWADGRLSLEDLSTGRSIELRAFGPTNEDAFARLLISPTATRLTRR